MDRDRIGDSDRERPPLDRALASPENKRRYVRRLFDTIADRYDLITVLLSFGRDRRWKERLVRIAQIDRGTRALDLACGTGDITYAVAGRGATVIGLDITERMVRHARKRGAPPFPPAPTGKNGPHPSFLVGDIMALPFDNASFDLVTTGYGIRNVPELEPALREVARVLRPGGVFLSLDFNRPDNAVLRSVYLAYLYLVGGALGWLLHRDPDTYRYIPATIRRYPGATRVAALMREQGFASADWLPVLGGLLAIHRGRRAR